MTNTNEVKTVKIKRFSKAFWYAGYVGQTFRVTEEMGNFVTEEMEKDRVRNAIGSHSFGRGIILRRDCVEVAQL